MHGAMFWKDVRQSRKSTANPSITLQVHVISGTGADLIVAIKSGPLTFPMTEGIRVGEAWKRESSVCRDFFYVFDGGEDD